MCLHHADWKINLKMCFHQTENSFPHKEYPRNGKKESLLENQFPQIGIANSQFQKLQQSSEKKTPSASQKTSVHQPECTFKKYVSKKIKLKNTFPLDGKTVFTAKNIWQMEKTVFYQPEKQFLLGARMFFFKNCPPRFDNGFQQQKTMNKRILIHLNRK